MPKYVRTHKFRDEPRVVVTTRAINDERVVYHYSYAEQFKIGCVSRGYFDANYRKLR